MRVNVFMKHGLPGPPPRQRQLADIDPVTEHALKIAQDLTGEHLPVEVIDLDSVKGQQLAEIYDIVATPQILVIADNGSVVKQWLPDELPDGAGEVRYYVGLNQSQLIDGTRAHKVIGGDSTDERRKQ